LDRVCRRCPVRTLVDLGIVNTQTHTSPPLHFIGHSFGSAVTSEAIERLARLGVPVDQVTYLDPHDFSQDLVFDTAQQQFTQGKPQPTGAPIGYGATVWNNVAFADVYYQTFGSDELPQGRPIPGAYNRLIVASDVGKVGIAHSQVWNEYYLRTVRNATTTDGYAFSRVVGKPRPNDTFAGPKQDHAHTPEALHRFQFQVDPAVRAQIPDIDVGLSAVNTIVSPSIPGRGTFEVRIVKAAELGAGDFLIAKTRAAHANVVTTVQGVAVVEPGTLFEAREGVDPNGNSADIVVELNLAKLTDLWIDPTGANRAGPSPRRRKTSSPCSCMSCSMAWGSTRSAARFWTVHALDTSFDGRRIAVTDLRACWQQRP